jgi:hypothetical protein
MAWTPENDAQLANSLRTWSGGVYGLYEQAKRIKLKHQANVSAAGAKLGDAEMMPAADMEDVLSLVYALVDYIEQGTPIEVAAGPIIGRALRNVGV